MKIVFTYEFILLGPFGSPCEPKIYGINSALTIDNSFGPRTYSQLKDVFNQKHRTNSHQCGQWGRTCRVILYSICELCLRNLSMRSRVLSVYIELGQDTLQAGATETGDTAIWSQRGPLRK